MANLLLLLAREVSRYNSINSKKSKTDRDFANMDEAERIVKHLADKHLPSGSGIDLGCKVDIKASSERKIVLFVDFHQTDEQGSYDGWDQYKVEVIAAFRDIPDLKITGGRSEYRSTKEYITQALDAAFATPVSSGLPLSILN